MSDTVKETTLLARARTAANVFEQARRHRDKAIFDAVDAGVSLSVVARDVGLSKSRVHRIASDLRKVA